MAEIRRYPWNGFNVVSTFSGCGGSSLGYKMAGFRVLWASEFVPAAQETYRANHPGTILDGRDIRTVSGSDILDSIGMKPGELDLFDGSPPCASFSTSGKREAGWGVVKKYSDRKQRTDDLFFEYSRLIREIRPKAFVAENVSGLVKGTAKGYFLEILHELQSCGYRVEARLLEGQWLGVPQMRQRLIFCGVREDLGIDPVFPKPLPFRYTVRDAIAGLDGQPVEPETDLGKSKVGEEWDKIRQGAKSEKYFNAIKVSFDRPCFTLTASGGGKGQASILHPTERRKFSIAELKRLSSFPDDFVLTGNYTRRWERLGRAVPPVMMSHIAAAVRDGVLVPHTQSGAPGR